MRPLKSSCHIPELLQANNLNDTRSESDICMDILFKSYWDRCTLGPIYRVRKGQKVWCIKGSDVGAQPPSISQKHFNALWRNLERSRPTDKGRHVSKEKRNWMIWGRVIKCQRDETEHPNPPTSKVQRANLPLNSWCKDEVLMQWNLTHSC